MDNASSPIDVHILPFFMKTDNEWFIFSKVYFFIIYFFGMLINIVIITVIYLDLHLHTPMYLFLWNLSLVDICYTTVTIPKLLHILLSGNNQMPFSQCVLQNFFFFITTGAEIVVLFTMAYDRYVAICHPLHYHQILNKRICTLLIMVIWIVGCVSSSLLTGSILKFLFCSSVTVHQFFCDAKALINIACRGTELFHTIMYADLLLFGILPMVCNLLSYINIIKVIRNIKSKDGKRKAFSTCSSHLAVMALYYGSVISVYMTPASDRLDILEQLLTMFYTTVVPILNPLIYSLRNKEIKRFLLRLPL